MFRILVILLLAVAGFQATAVDADFNGEYRYRVTSSSSLGEDMVNSLGTSLSPEFRAKVSGSFRPSESFEGVVGSYINIDRFVELDLSMDDVAYVAYGDWMISDEFMLRAGKSTYKIADGSVLGINDYDLVPSLFTGLFLTHSSENVGLDLALIQNPQVKDLLVVSVDARSFPDLVKTANFHFIIQNVKQKLDFEKTVLSSESLPVPPVVPTPVEAPAQPSPAEAGVQPQPPQQQPPTKESDNSKGYYLGATLGGGVGGFGYKVTASTDSLANVLSFSNLLLDGKVSYSLEMDNSSLKVYAGGHMDGSDYDTLLYERHYNAGKMDRVVWGRGLTYAYGGLSYRTNADWKVGLKGYYFMKSNKESLRAKNLPPSLVNDGDMEVDVYVKKSFNSSVSGKIWAGAWVPKADGQDMDVKAQAVVQMKF